MHNQITYKQFGLKAILIEWQPIISEQILQDILVFKRKIKSKKFLKIIDLIQGYNSLTIVFEHYIINFDEEVKRLKTIYKSSLEKVDQQFYQWEIPVCYDLQFGIDLEELAIKSNLEIEEIIHLHSQVIYRVYFIGFLPGFLYLGGLDSKIHFDRKPNPRITVPKGTVAIGGKQTGIYPNVSAGGWNIIGKTPVFFFDINKENPCFAKPGDYIKFNSISIEEFRDLESKINSENYQPIKTLHNA